VSAAHILSEVGSRRTAVVGRDPRASGEFLQSAVTAGLASAGVDVIDVGVLPTPAVAYLTKVRQADLGVMLSASHNAMPDNGIKFFNAEGNKLARSDRGTDRGATARVLGPSDRRRGRAHRARRQRGSPSTSDTCCPASPLRSTGSLWWSTAPTARRVWSAP
jgi:phosphomannomutase